MGGLTEGRVRKSRVERRSVKITFDFKWTDGYLPPAEDEQFVWGIKLTPKQEQNFKKTHPDLYTLAGKVDYPIITMS